LLRRVGYRDPETGKHQVFLTNAFQLAAKTIAAIYKERGQIVKFMGKIGLGVQQILRLRLLQLNLFKRRDLQSLL